ncbi:hypothetical protein C8R47DRAFT_1076546 [Mycena vitilis]|nr:hypothetical protein C8R47DRAFT_1076546 [Mycena vitilis]
MDPAGIPESVLNFRYERQQQPCYDPACTLPHTTPQNHGPHLHSRSSSFAVEPSPTAESSRRDLQGTEIAINSPQTHPAPALLTPLFAALQSHAQNLAAAFESRDTKITALERQLSQQDDAKKQLVELRDAYARLEVQRMTGEKRCAFLETSLATSERGLHAAFARIVALQSEHAECATTIETQRVDIVRYNTRAVLLESKHAGCAKTIEAQRADIDSYFARVIALESEHAGCAMTIDTQRTEIDSQNARVVVLESEHAGSAKTIETQRAEIGSHSARVVALEAEHTEFAKTIETLRADIDSHNTRFVALESEHAGCAKMIETQRADIDSHNARAVSLEAEHAGCATTIETQRADIDRHNARIVSIESEHAGCATAIETRRAAIDSHNARIVSLESEHADIVKTIETQRVEIDSHNARVVSLESAHTALKSKHARCTKIVETQRAEIDSQKARVVALQSVHAEFTKTIETEGAEIKRLREVPAAPAGGAWAALVSVQTENARLRALLPDHLRSPGSVPSDADSSTALEDFESANKDLVSANSKLQSECTVLLQRVESLTAREATNDGLKEECARVKAQNVLLFKLARDAALMSLKAKGEERVVQGAHAGVLAPRLNAVQERETDDAPEEVSVETPKRPRRRMIKSVSFALPPSSPPAPSSSAPTSRASSPSPSAPIPCQISHPFARGAPPASPPRSSSPAVPTARRPTSSVPQPAESLNRVEKKASGSIVNAEHGPKDVEREIIAEPKQIATRRPQMHAPISRSASLALALPPSSPPPPTSSPPATRHAPISKSVALPLALPPSSQPPPISSPPPLPPSPLFHCAPAARSKVPYPPPPTSSPPPLPPSPAFHSAPATRCKVPYPFARGVPPASPPPSSSPSSSPSIPHAHPSLPPRPTTSYTASISPAMSPRKRSRAEYESENTACVDAPALKMQKPATPTWVSQRKPLSPLKGAPTAAASAAAPPRKLGISHLDLLYTMTPKQMRCRHCAPGERAVFAATAPWGELVGHSLAAHPSECAELLKPRRRLWSGSNGSRCL